MPVVTRSMSNSDKPSPMETDTPPKDLSSKKVVKIIRKRKRRLPEAAQNKSVEKPAKRRRRNRKHESSQEEKSSSSSSPKRKQKKRSAVIQAVSKSDRTTSLSMEEIERIETMQQMEKRLCEEENFQWVVGCDEAGRGPLAGPVVAAACHIPLDIKISQLTDSKALTEEQREEIYEQLVNDERIIYGVSIVSHTKIDEINILQAALLGMRESCVEVNKKLMEKSEKESEKKEASESAKMKVDYILVDGNRDPRFELCEEEGLVAESETVVKGDAKVYCIAAASIIAKVTRDRLMVEYDKQFPLYNFAQHKGYPTPEHKRLVHEHGPCDIHRRSFQPVKGIVGWERPKKNGDGEKKKRRRRRRVKKVAEEESE